ncbi:MAG: ATP-dependent DNA helicase RecG [Clostridia bacterium]|nr:ATP-dependent DNA helicase RecG [Clostridia bacterium]
MLLSLPLNTLNRVGKQTEKSLNKLGLETVEDLLFYFPFRYDDFSQIIPIEKIESGMNVSIQGEIEIIENKRSFKQKKNLTEALISDETGTIKIIWFNQPYISQNLKAGDKVSLAGKVTESYGQLTLISPQYEKDWGKNKIHTQGLIPIYHLRAGITQKQLRFLIDQCLDARENIQEWLPVSVTKEIGLISLKEAIKQIHFPESQEKVKAAHLRLGFSELFLRQMQSQKIKQELQTKKAYKIEFQEELSKKFVASLDFNLTNSQKNSAWEILQDINKVQPMSRLLEGDVGSGKTIVAVMVLLNTAANHKQSALMAPTEILAYQHYQNIDKLLNGFNIKLALITGKLNEANFDLPKSKKEARQTIINEAEIIIGTHALIQNYNIDNLALVIVDEQHRFGVKQRQRLQQSGGNLTPHFLSMTATPIPRSLALSIYGDLDISLITELPQGRKTTITQIISEEQRPSVYNFIKQEIDQGRQAFVICPLIDESDKLGVRSAKAELKHLTEIFPSLTIGLIHGQIKSQEKEKIMSDFADNKIKILIATAVVEVGVDVPNASIMLIEGAERFGLSQLHQFRGRIGRDKYQSYCFLLSTNDEQSSQAAQRFKALIKYHDGLSISEIDLKLRGAGDLYGVDQSGFPELKIASLFDYYLIKKAKEVAERIIKNNPDLSRYPLLKEKLNKHSDAEVHLE